MARIKLELPSTIHFSTSIPVRVTDLNYGGHLGNDSLLSLLHEARVRLLASHGYTEKNIEGVAIIMNDAAIVYKSEAFYNDILHFHISVIDFHRFGCDLFYRVTRDTQIGNTESRTVEVARAKTGIVFYDYEQKKLVDVPEKFREHFHPSSDLT
ncbi:MAG: thioesterase family protein [Ignavibacteriae bacterium]|nr:thioesterase family protein [Ignavibacteriota bacterium]